MKLRYLFCVLFVTVLLSGCSGYSEVDDERATELAKKGDEMTQKEVEEAVDLIVRGNDSYIADLEDAVNTSSSNDEYERKIKDIDLKHEGFLKLANYIERHPEKLNSEQTKKYEEAHNKHIASRKKLREKMEKKIGEED